MSTFDGATVLVTGAASGIGRLLVERSLTRGSRVVAWDVDGPGLAALRSRHPGADLLTEVVDVTDRHAVYRAAVRCGDVDILILNAGVVSGARLLDLPDAAIERVIGVNVLGLFWCTKAFLPAMVARDSGHIVAIASLAAIIPMPGLTDYVASKHAAYGFLESLRTELIDDAPGVRTTVVNPQVIDTGMFEGVTVPRLFPLLKPDYVADRIIDGIERDKDRLLLDRPALLTAYMARMLPPRLSDRVLRAFGAFDGMTSFQGRSVIDRRDRRPVSRA